MNELNVLWGPIRSLLEREFSFNSIKELVALSGLDITGIAHLQQRASGGATKGQLICGVDAVYTSIPQDQKKRFLVNLTEEVLRRRGDLQEHLEEHLSRIGWSFQNSYFLPTELLDVID